VDGRGSGSLSVPVQFSNRQYSVTRRFCCFNSKIWATQII